MERSDSIKELVTALVKFQTTVGKIKKDSNNPFFKSKYAALPDILDSIHQPLIECGLTVNQFPTGNNGLTTIVAHTSGEFLMDTYFMTPSKNDPQGIGSCITYQRRYALGGVLNLNIDEDDDGNAASTPPVAKATPKAPESSGRNNPELSKEIGDAIVACKSRDEVNAIWKANVALQKNEKFVKLIEAKTKEFPKPQPIAA